MEAKADRRCEECGGPIPAGKRSDAKYCSVACGNRVRHRRAGWVPREAPTVCQRCGGPLPEGSAALRQHCDECRRQLRRERDHRYLAEHREENRLKSRAYHQAHREELRQAARDYRAANIDAIRAKQREYTVRNRRNRRKWYEENAEYLREYAKQYAQAHPETQRASRHRRRARVYGADAVPYSGRQLKERMALFGDMCWACGAEAEHVDHIVPLSPRPGDVTGADRVDNLAPLCAPCNMSKKNHALPRWMPRRLGGILDIPDDQAQAELDALVAAATGRPAAETWDLFYAEEPDYAAITEAVLMLAAVLGTRPAELAA